MIDDQNMVWIGDFGSSKFYDEAKKNKNTPHVVSLYYRAPELCLGDLNYNHKIDIWAAGVIFLEMFV